MRLFVGAFLNFKAKLGCSLQQMLRLLQLNLFAKRDLMEIFKPPQLQHTVSPQLLLYNNL